MAAKRGGRSGKAPKTAAKRTRTPKPKPEPAKAAGPPSDPDPFGDKAFLEKMRREALTPRERRMGVTAKGEKLPPEDPDPPPTAPRGRGKRGAAAIPAVATAPEPPPLPKIGRPTVFRPDMLEQILKMGRQGYTVTEMAIGLGIAKKTLYLWLADPRMGEFHEAFELARDLSEAFHAADFRQNAGAPSMLYNSAGKAKFMALCFRDWRIADRVELSGPEGKPVAVAVKPDLTALTDDQLLAIEALGRTLHAGGGGMARAA